MPSRIDCNKIKVAHDYCRCAHTIVSCVYLVSLNYIFHGCRDRSAADLFADVEEEGQEYYDLSWSFLVLSHPLFSCGRVKTRKRNAMTLEVSKM